MKIKTSKELLQQAISITENVVSPRTTLPILSNILIETIDQNKVRFAATDLDMGVVCNIKAEVEEAGAITVPAKKINDIIRELPAGEIIITSKKNYAVTIECEKAFFKLVGLPKEDFPNLPNITDKEIIILEQLTLKQMLKKTSFAMSREETRYILNGVLLVVKPTKVIVVATDGRRLAKIEKNISMGKDFNRQVIIPLKAVNEIMRILKDEGKINIALGENQVIFEMDDIVLTTRQIEGEYPNYEQVIPKEIEDKVFVDREKFLAAVKRAGIFTSTDSQSIKIDLFKNKMVISKSTPDIGEAREEIEVEYKGTELTVGFNPVYIIDALKNLEENSITMELVNMEKPGVIRDGKDYVYIVLPMQLI
ncbi:MAG: DNA polymerase III subunit beta [Candidatus Omnitrophota bacterium]